MDDQATGCWFLFHWEQMLLWTMDVGYEKKTIFHSFKEVVIEFVPCKMRLICERWECVVR